MNDAKNLIPDEYEFALHYPAYASIDPIIRQWMKKHPNAHLCVHIKGQPVRFIEFETFNIFIDFPNVEKNTVLLKAIEDKTYQTVTLLCLNLKDLSSYLDQAYSIFS